MFNNWFTIDLVEAIVPAMRTSNANESKVFTPIKLQESNKKEQQVAENELTVRAFVYKIHLSKHFGKSIESDKMTSEHDLANSKLAAFTFMQIMKTTERFKKSLNWLKIEQLL